jgi:superfamily II DNA or RNA helicase
VPLAPGLYDLPLTRGLRDLIDQNVQRLRASTAKLDPSDSNELLSRHVATIVRAMLLTIPEGERLTRQVEICNQLLGVLRATLNVTLEGKELVAPAERLTALFEPTAFRNAPASEPDIPLSQSDLLVNAAGEPRVGPMLQSEIESADRIDALIAFIRWSGLRLVEPKLREFLEAGKAMRVITTTYTGSTERRAIERLVELGAEVKVSYQTDNTRLHAKAWLFHRESGFSTAYIGSSNLTTSALVDGMEWNVRLSEVDAPTIMEKFRATFETYWADADFELYDPALHRDRFDQAVAGAREEPFSDIVFFDIQPKPHQLEILERLHVERYRHARWKNLVVAATGTGKTVVAAFDYERLNEEFGRKLRLLFVAHRREILRQSIGTFRAVMHDGSFGELYVDGARPSAGDHVFASVQSLANVDLSEIPEGYFDVVIVDEFHHAAAPTYQRLLRHLKPQVLLGLTATPERTDGQSILEWFDGRYAVELRLWDALERGLLSPFHYFGLHDGVDLAAARWTRGHYDAGDLENLYTGNDARLNVVLHALQAKVSDIQKMRALGFCVGVSHATYMARRFNEAGIPAAAVLGDTSSVDRDAALRRLRAGELKAIFAVDIFNEGVDVPEIDTVLFLRPTESPTVFLQQLGRGLRRAKEKAVLTVLDFIGNANRNFRFDLRYRALTGGTRREVEEQLERGFPLLPAGCAIQLDREASRIVLENLRAAIGNRFASLVAELRGLGAGTSLQRFIEESRIDVEDVYRTRGWSWTKLQREAGLLASGSGDLVAERPFVDGSDRDEELLLTAIQRVLHMDEAPRIAFLRELLGRPAAPEIFGVWEQRVVEGLLLTLLGKDEKDRALGLARLWHQPAVLAELREVLGVLEDRAEHETRPLSQVMREDQREAAARRSGGQAGVPVPQHGDPGLTLRHETQSAWEDVPLSLHARYSLDEVTAAIGRSTLAKPVRLQGGALWDPATNADYFFITLEKSEKHYSPTTRYRDYAISPEEFHWESQSTTREASETGQRYIHHRQRASEIFLFVRQTRKVDGARTAPYTFLGPADYLRHTGEMPMAIVWRLRHAMPLDVFKRARVAAG